MVRRRSRLLRWTLGVARVLIAGGLLKQRTLWVVLFSGFFVLTVVGLVGRVASS